MSVTILLESGDQLLLESGDVALLEIDETAAAGGLAAVTATAYDATVTAVDHVDASAEAASARSKALPASSNNIE